MSGHLANAAWGVLDYAAYPMGMLLVAPIVLRNMGPAEYGVWTVVTAVVGLGSIVAAGFGDANIQHVASQRGRRQPDLLIRTVRCMISVNLLLGSALAIVAWMLAGKIAQHVVSSNPSLQMDCLWSIRLACALIWIRTMESVCISTQRAFERYGAAVRISIVARLLSLIVGAALTYVVHYVVILIAAAVFFNLSGTWLQFKRLSRLLHADVFAPAFDRGTLKVLLGFGLFSWLQAVSGIVFGQADRLFLGVSYGAVAVASYALCTQLAQPVYGIAASGLHFVFPHLSERTTSNTPTQLRRVIVRAFTANALIVALVSMGIVAVGPYILHIWAGKQIPGSAFRVLPIIVAGSALVGLNVTATYSLFALGGVRVVAWMNIIAAAAMLALMAYLSPRLGAYGLALARLSYGVVTLFLYVPLVHSMSKGRLPLSLMAAKPVCEEM